MAYNGNTRFPKSITKGVIQTDFYNYYEEIGDSFPPPPGDYLIQQDGFYILQQDGSYIRILT